jgi:hypothetical protein
VNNFHAAAVERGAQDAGAPGPRPDYGPDFYGAFIIDNDGNKLEATLLPLPAAPKKKAKKAVKKAAKKAAPVKKSPAKKVAKKAAKKVVKKPTPVKKAKKAKKAKRR